jgi:hypothetical protein
MKDKKLKQVLFRGEYQWVAGGNKERVIGDVFCDHIWKYNNEACRNCSKKGGVPCLVIFHIPLPGCATVYLSIHVLKDITLASRFL